MKIKIIEFKAKVSETQFYEEKLKTKSALYKGLDHQIDTYFNATKGRLKLREGTIESALIQYDRENTASSKLSEVVLYKHKADKALKNILTHHLGVKIVVDKKRKIYFMDNVKFHFDEADQLGAFIEVEAIDETGNLKKEFLKEQCDFWFKFFELKQEQLMKESYSDMLLNQLTMSNEQ